MIDEEFIEEWIKQKASRETDPRSDLHWTEKYVVDLICDESRHQELWKFITETISGDLPESVCVYLACGPVESILSKHGEIYIDEIERIASVHQGFRDLLGGVWRSKMSQDIWDRVCAVRGEVR